MDALPSLYSSDIIKVRKARHEKGNEYKLTVGRSKGRGNLYDPVVDGMIMKWIFNE
jgi:hypothetical protein